MEHETQRDLLCIDNRKIFVASPWWGKMSYLFVLTFHKYCWISPSSDFKIKFSVADITLKKSNIWNASLKFPLHARYLLKPHNRKGNVTEQWIYKQPRETRLFTINSISENYRRWRASWWKKKCGVMLSQLNNVTYPKKVKINLKIYIMLLIITYFHSSRTCLVLEYSSRF